MSTDPNKVLNEGGLLPLGGEELTGGYKGYGLSLMVELFCGMLAGANWGPNIRKWRNTSVEADLGQCFVAIDPEAFAPGFAPRLKGFLDTFRNLPPVESELAVLVPGDPEKSHCEMCDSLGGIPYHPKEIEHLKSIAVELGVHELTPLNEQT